jgi:hypothetical protein
MEYVLWVRDVKQAWENTGIRGDLDTVCAAIINGDDRTGHAEYRLSAVPKRKDSE